MALVLTDFGRRVVKAYQKATARTCVGCGAEFMPFRKRQVLCPTCDFDLFDEPRDTSRGDPRASLIIDGYEMPGEGE